VEGGAMERVPYTRYIVVLYFCGGGVVHQRLTFAYGWRTAV